MFFIYLQGRVFDGSKIATNFNPLKICVTLKYDYERTYHKSLTLKILFYPTKFLESRSFPGAFPLELPWIHWGPQDPLPTTDTPSNFKSWIFPGVLSYCYCSFTENIGVELRTGSLSSVNQIFTQIY